MNFQNLDYFVTTAAEKSFTRAAEKLYITQQSLSGQIAALEKEIGCKLFYRTKPLELTEAGRVFHSYATGILHDYRKMQGAMAMISRVGTDALSIGISFSHAYPFLKESFAEYRRLSPTTQIQIVEMPGSDLIDRLRDGALDFVIAHFPEHDPAFVRYPLFDEEVVLLATDELLRNIFGREAGKVTRLLARGEGYDLLDRCPYVHSTRRNIVARFADRFVEEHGISPGVTTDTDSFETMLEICRSSMAFSFFPKIITSEIMHDKTLAPFHVFPLGASARFTVHYGYLKGSPRSAAIEAFIEVTAKEREKRLRATLPSPGARRGTSKTSPSDSSPDYAGRAARLQPQEASRAPS